MLTRLSQPQEPSPVRAERKGRAVLRRKQTPGKHGSTQPSRPPPDTTTANPQPGARSEGDLRQTERLLAIIEATTDLIDITDPNSDRFLYLNRAGRMMLGIDEDADLAQFRVQDFYPPAVREQLRAAVMPAVMQEGVWRGEISFCSRKDREVAVSLLMLAHRGPDGKVEFLSSIGRDITESKRDQEALRRSEQLFRVITENVTELVALVDTTGRRLYNSPSYQTVLGYSPEELQGTWSFEQIHPEDREKLLVAAEETKRTGVGRFVEYRMRHRDGSWRTLESHAGVIHNPQGQIENILIVARDITERKEAEKERERMEVQLRHAQKMESIGQLAAGIAHEINTPIQYIGDNARFLHDAFSDLSRLLAEYGRLVEAVKSGGEAASLAPAVEAAAREIDLGYLQAEIPKALEQSLDGLDRVSKIVSAMKEFSHPGSEERSAVDLNKALESTLTVSRNEWKYVAEVVTDFDPHLPSLLCLPGELNQAFLNLIVNAAHAIAQAHAQGGPAKGTITISARHSPDWVEVRIADTGTGIPELIRHRIFEPFFTTKPLGKGTGQGLAIVHSVVVEKHGGTVSFETEVNQGTTFILRLPRNPPPSPPARTSV